MSKEKKGGIENLEKRISQSTLLVLLTIVVIVFFIFRETDLIGLIKRINLFYLFILVLCLFAVWFFNGVKLYLVVKLSGGKIRFWKSIEIMFASIFGSNITPFYSGAIPTQVYFLSKFAESVGRSTAISVVYMILTLIVYLVFSVILIITPHQFISGGRNTFFMSLAIFVFVFSFFTFFFMKYPKKIKRVIEFVSKKIANEKFDSSSLEHSIDEFSEGLTLFFSANKLLVTATLFIAFVSQSFFLMLTPLSFKALSISAPIKEIILTQIAMQFTTSIGATPGGIGIMDAAFAAFFKPLAPHAIAQLTFLYRMISFYIPTFVGGLFFYKLLREEKALYRQKIKKERTNTLNNLDKSV